MTTETAASAQRHACPSKGLLGPTGGGKGWDARLGLLSETDDIPPLQLHLGSAPRRGEMLQALGHLRPASLSPTPGLPMSTDQTEKAYDEYMRRIEKKREEVIENYEAQREEQMGRRWAREDPAILVLPRSDPES